jgi:hypothetical protein
MFENVAAKTAGRTAAIVEIARIGRANSNRVSVTSIQCCQLSSSCINYCET